MAFPIKYQGISSIGWFGLSVIGFVNLVYDTHVSTFLSWVSFGLLQYVMDFIFNYTPYLGGLCFAIVFLKWTKNVWILFPLFIAFVFFVKYGLSALGIGGV